MYYAVIFTSIRTGTDDGYAEMGAWMEELARQQDGFMGMDSARNEVGITVSYWRDLESIQAWKRHADHLVAQEKGRTHWYERYTIRICRVEREYGFER